MVRLEAVPSGGQRVPRRSDTDPRISYEWLHDQHVARGRSLSDIGAELGVSQQRVSQWTKEYGVPPRQQPTSLHRVAELSAQGLSAGEIAAALDRHPSTVRLHQRRLGLRQR